MEADKIILGSPVYFLDITAEMKGLINRAGLVSRANEDPEGGLYLRKVGMAIAVMRRSGGSHTLGSMIHFLLATGMVVPGFPILGVGLNPGDVENDQEGLAGAERAGKIWHGSSK